MTTEEASSAVSDSLLVGGTHGHVEEVIDGDLLVLWRAPMCDWKPIRNCTGRYTCREKKARQMMEPYKTSTNDESLFLPSQMDPIMLMEYAVRSADAEGHCTGPALGPNVWTVQEFDPAPGRTDRILVLPLDPQQQTGIITYVKRQDDTNTGAGDNDNNGEQNSAGGLAANNAKSHALRFIHTLNAPSGFQRKLEAVGIQLK